MEPRNKATCMTREDFQLCKLWKTPGEEDIPKLTASLSAAISD